MLAVSAMRSIGDDKITDDILSAIRKIVRNVSPEMYEHDIRLAPAWVRKNLKNNMIFTDLTDNDRRDIIDYVSGKTGFLRNVVEKDWWVTSVLRAIFSLPYADNVSFKGGTNLSKCWGLIQRMSEDIDIGISREFLGFGGELSKNQISDKLRRASCSFVRNIMRNDVENALVAQGISPDAIIVTVQETKVSTVDPETIYVAYKSLYGGNRYILPQVKIEVSGRSMTEPVSKVSVRSYISENLPKLTFQDNPVEVNAVIPQRTFLEKLFLLHEEFSKPDSEIRVERMSRHLYDVYNIMQTKIADEALAHDNLYDSVIEHRRKFIGLKGFDYDSLRKGTLKIAPTGEIRAKWETDYKNTVANMIMGEAPSFEDIMLALEDLNNRINKS